MKLKELRERAALAWRILRDRDGNLVAHAEREFEASSYRDGDRMNELMASQIVDLLRVFGTHGHSGFSAFHARGLFAKLAAFEPLGPLTGVDAEWADLGELCDNTHWQNKRCSHVFKDKDGRAYDIQAVVFEEPNGGRFTGKHSHMTVTFPYTPRSVIAKVSAGASDDEQKAAAADAWATV